MDKEMVLGNIYLKAVLPLLEDIVEYDDEAKKITKGWKCSVMFHVGGGGPAVTLKFRDGKCDAIRSAIPLPSVAMYLPQVSSLNRMFAGENVMPIPWLGFWHPKILMDFTPLTKRLDYYMKPSDALLANEKDFKFIVELMLYAALNGAAQVGMHDPEAKEVMDHTPDGSVEIKIMPDGPAATLTKKGDMITVAKGPAPGPIAAYMELKDHKLAYDLFQGKVDAMAALGNCDVRIRGLLTFVDNINYCLDKVGTYLA